MVNILKKTVDLIKPHRPTLVVLFFCYLVYVIWGRWHHAPYAHGDFIRAFDYWWYFQHRLEEGAIAQWNPYYLMGMPAVLWYHIAVSIFTPFLLFVNDFTPELFADLQAIGYILGALAIYFLGRNSGHDRFISILPLAFLFLTFEFSTLTYVVEYTEYFLFFPMAIAFLYHKNDFLDRNDLLRWVLFALFLSLAFLGCRIEMLVHTVGFLCIFFAISTFYQLQSGLKSACRYFLLSFCSLGLAVLSNAWQLTMLLNVMKGGIRIAAGAQLSKAFDPSTYEWIYTSIVHYPESSLIVLIGLNLLFFLLLKPIPLASRKLPLIPTLIFIILVTALELFALNLRHMLHSSPPEAGIAYHLSRFLSSPRIFFTLGNFETNKIICVMLGFCLFFIQVGVTVANLLLFWVVVLVGLYMPGMPLNIIVEGARAMFGPSIPDLGFYIVFLGGLGMLIKKRSDVLVALVSFIFFTTNLKFFLYDVLGIIWLAMRDYPLLMPFYILLILEGMELILTGMSSIILVFQRSRKLENQHMPSRQLNNQFTLFLQFSCLFFAFYATSMFVISVPNGAGKNGIYVETVTAYEKSNEIRKTNEGNYSKLQWHRSWYPNAGEVLRMYLQVPNVYNFYSTEIPRAMYNALNPDLDIEGISRWHSSMESLFLERLKNLGYPFKNDNSDYMKMYHLSVDMTSTDIDRVLSREILAYTGSKTERAFLTDQVVGFEDFKGELNFLKTVIASGGYLANQVTTSDPEFPATLLLQSVKRFSSSLYGSNSSGGLAIQTGLLRKQRGVDYKLEFKKDSPELVVFEVESNEDAYLALMDLWGKGWRAYVDGQETKIYKGYVGARFIEVRKGKHIVEFKYRVPGFFMGCTLSLLAWAAIIGVGIRASRSPAQEIRDRFLAVWAIIRGRLKCSQGGKTRVCIAGEFSEGIGKDKAKAFLASMGARFVEENNGKARVSLEYRSLGFLLASLSSLMVWPVFMLVGARNCRVSITPAPEIEAGEVYRNVLITGVSEGLGKEMAKAFLSRQCRVLGISRRRPEQFDPENEWTGDDNFQHLAGDLESPVFRKELASMTKDHDLVIFNAALLEEDIVAGRFDSEKCRRMMELNCLCNLEIVQLICDESSKDKPMVFCAISSLSALVEANPNMVGYNTSKAALSMSFRALSAQYEGRPWRFVSMHPGKLRKSGDGIFQVSFKTAAERIVSTLVVAKGVSYFFPLPNYVILKIIELLPAFLRNFVLKAIRNKQDNA